jgi:hypothetical protein
MDINYGNRQCGTKLTRDLCLKDRKAFLVMDCRAGFIADAIDGVGMFIVKQNIRVLNVAGPRGSGWDRGHEFAFDIITGVIASKGTINRTQPQ